MFRWNRSVLASLNLQLSCEANFVSRVYASDDQVKMVVRGVSCRFLLSLNILRVYLYWVILGSGF